MVPTPAACDRPPASRAVIIALRPRGLRMSTIALRSVRRRTPGASIRPGLLADRVATCAPAADLGRDGVVGAPTPSRPPRCAASLSRPSRLAMFWRAGHDPGHRRPRNLSSRFSSCAASLAFTRRPHRRRSRPARRALHRLAGRASSAAARLSTPPGAPGAARLGSASTTAPGACGSSPGCGAVRRSGPRGGLVIGFGQLAMSSLRARLASSPRGAATWRGARREASSSRCHVEVGEATADRLGQGATGLSSSSAGPRSRGRAPAAAASEARHHRRHRLPRAMASWCLARRRRDRGASGPVSRAWRRADRRGRVAPLRSESIRSSVLWASAPTRGGRPSCWRRPDVGTARTCGARAATSLIADRRSRSSRSRGSAASRRALDLGASWVRTGYRGRRGDSPPGGPTAATVRAGLTSTTRGDRAVREKGRIRDSTAGQPRARAPVRRSGS